MKFFAKQWLELVLGATDKLREMNLLKRLKYLENVLIKHNNASPNIMIQKWVTQVILVKDSKEKNCILVTGK